MRPYVSAVTKMIGPTRILAIGAAALMLTACGDDDSNTSPPDNTITNIGAADFGFRDAGSDRASDRADADEIDMSVNETDTETFEPDVGTGSSQPVTPDPVVVEWPATADEFIASATDVSYIHDFTLPQPDARGYPTCCRDFGAQSKRPGPDNALGSLMQQITNLQPDSGASDLLEQSLRDGQVVVLLDHRAFEGESDDDGYALSWLRGTFSDTTEWSGAAEGLGEFLVDRESFIPNSGEPRVVMNPTLVHQGQSSGGPVALQLDVPVGFALVPVTVHETRIESRIRIGESGVGYSEGVLSGFAETAEIFRALNEVVATNCACLELADDLYSRSPTGNWSGSCTSMAHVMCDQPEQEVCRVLGGANVIDDGYCSVLPQILQNTSDIDSDGDGEWDSLSIGLKWSAVPAHLE